MRAGGAGSRRSPRKSNNIRQPPTQPQTKEELKNTKMHPPPPFYPQHERNNTKKKTQRSGCTTPSCPRSRCPRSRYGFDLSAIRAPSYGILAMVKLRLASSLTLEYHYPAAAHEWEFCLPRQGGAQQLPALRPAHHAANATANI